MGMPIDSSDDPVQRWRALADDARAAAEQATDPDARRSLLAIAEGYERLAKREAERAKGNKSPPGT